MNLFAGIALVAGALLLGWFIARARDAKHLNRRIQAIAAPTDPQFERTVGALLQSPLLEGNRVNRLRNGDQIFPAMLEAIAAAEKTVCFETFVYWSGDTGKRFAHALADRARAGVTVQVLLDWVGSKPMDLTLIDLLTDAGCEVRRFHRPNWRHPSRLNHRTHRKLLVIDGRVGFTGGVGIADEWSGDAEDPDHWRDSHFRLEGPTVAQMQAAFMVNWIRTTGDVETGSNYFPALEPMANGNAAHLYLSSPDEGSENARLAFLLAIAAARESIQITAAYFVPDRLSRRHLIAAARRGVTVEVIVPGPHTDSRLVRHAGRALSGSLLEAGVRIFEFAPTMLHAKTLVVDGRWVCVGSANIDQRSFRLNDEANLQIMSPELATELSEDFAHDRQRSDELTLEAWRARPLGVRILDRLATVLRSQL